MTTRKIIYANNDLHHHVRISVVEAQISPLETAEIQPMWNKERQLYL